VSTSWLGPINGTPVLETYKYHRNNGEEEEVFSLHSGLCGLFSRLFGLFSCLSCLLDVALLLFEVQEMVQLKQSVKAQTLDVVKPTDFSTLSASSSIRLICFDCVLSSSKLRS
jgi:hypothetical protein